jgi:integrase
VQLRSDFRDAADFAFLCGARQMEVLTLTWADVDREAQIVHLRWTKTGRPRSIHYAQWPELAAVIARRAAVDERLKRAAVTAPWVFCFSTRAAVRGREYHAAGAPLFKDTGERGLLAALRSEWASACAGAGLPGRLFHDLRRSAARNFEHAGIPRSVAMKLGGWSDKIYSRYAIGADSELAPAGAALSDYLNRAGWHWGETPNQIKGKDGGGGRESN